jgi:hypothetical protein
MKNLKNLVLLAVFGICSLFVFGVGKVSAVSSTSVVCNPEAVEYGEKTTCVLYANLDGDNPYYAMLLHVGLIDLEPVNGASSMKAGWSSGVGTEYFAGTGKTNTFKHLKDKDGNAYACESTKITTDGYKEGCLLIYSSSESSPALKSNPEKGKLTAIAKFELRLKKQDVKTCGKICVGGTAFATNNMSSSEGSTYTHGTGECQEVEVKGDKDPEPVPTGNFTSYIILAAGAFIALCAVLVAKKNNRFYRV